MNNLRDEKEEILQKLLSQGKVEEEDPLQDLGLEEIKIQNKKLRNAISSLMIAFEEEKKKMLEQFKMDTTKDQKIAELEAKVREMDFLFDEVQLKDEELQEM